MIPASARARAAVHDDGAHTLQPQHNPPGVAQPGILDPQHWTAELGMVAKVEVGRMVEELTARAPRKQLEMEATPELTAKALTTEVVEDAVYIPDQREAHPEATADEW